MGESGFLIFFVVLLMGFGIFFMKGNNYILNLKANQNEFQSANINAQNYKTVMTKFKDQIESRCLVSSLCYSKKDETISPGYLNKLLEVYKLDNNNPETLVCLAMVEDYSAQINNSPSDFETGLNYLKAISNTDNGRILGALIYADWGLKLKDNQVQALDKCNQANYLLNQVNYNYVNGFYDKISYFMACYKLDTLKIALKQPVSADFMLTNLNRINQLKLTNPKNLPLLYACSYTKFTIAEAFLANNNMIGFDYIVKGLDDLDELSTYENVAKNSDFLQKFGDSCEKFGQIAIEAHSNNYAKIFYEHAKKCYKTCLSLNPNNSDIQSKINDIDSKLKGL